MCRFPTSFLGSSVVTGAALKQKVLEAQDSEGITLASLVTQGPDPATAVAAAALRPEQVAG